LLGCSGLAHVVQAAFFPGQHRARRRRFDGAGRPAAWACSGALAAFASSGPRACGWRWRARLSAGAGAHAHCSGPAGIGPGLRAAPSCA